MNNEYKDYLFKEYHSRDLGSRFARPTQIGATLKGDKGFIHRSRSKPTLIKPILPEYRYIILDTGTATLYLITLD